MKTIDKALETIKSSPVYKVGDEFLFKAGVEFAQKWIPISECQPQHRSWVLVKTDLCRFPCQVCQVRIDKFISTDNFIVANVTHWRPISFL